MKKFLFYVVTLALVLWIQMGVNHVVGASGLSADIVLVVTLYFGLSRGPVPGEMLGFLWGLLVDASSLGLMGLHALLYAAAGYLAGMLRRQLDEKKVWTQAIFSFGVSWVYLLLYFVLDRLFSQGPHAVSWAMLAQPVANMIIAPVFFWVMQQWSHFWNLSMRDE